MKGHILRSVVDDKQRELREALSSARLLHLAMLVTGKKIDIDRLAIFPLHRIDYFPFSKLDYRNKLNTPIGRKVNV